MNFYVGNQVKFGNHVYLEVEIGPQAETIEGLVRKILAALGLTDISLIENFNVFLGYDFFRNVINKASVDPTAKKAIKDSKGRRVKVPIDVYPEVIEDQIRNLPQNKRPPGEWFYKPTISETADLGNGVLGATFKYGDIKYLSRLSGKAKDATVLHEKVHRWLTPKFYPLRNFRVTLNWNSYAKSSILRYLEEALAQTVGQVGVYGFRQIFSGITFPVKNGYVTIAEMGIEMKGIFLGPLNVGGMTYRAYFSYSDSAKE